MTTIGGASGRIQPFQPQQADVPASPASEQPIPKVLIGVGIGTGVLATAAAGVGILASRGHVTLPFGNHASKVIGAVDGVELLSNPRLPRGTKATWSEPATGTLFGPEGARVSIEHVDQGALGDCWNIAGMGAIADVVPEQIERLVRPASDGRHVIVDLPGERRSVAVTKELPLRSDGSPAFGGSDDVDPIRWPAYIEKAQAAIEPNGYRSLVGGWSRTTFQQLLDADPRQVRLPEQSVFEGARTGLQRNEPVTLSSYARSDEPADTFGVHGNHAYVVRPPMPSDPPETIRVFNPWGDGHPERALARDEVDSVFRRVTTPSFWGDGA